MSKFKTVSKKVKLQTNEEYFPLEKDEEHNKLVRILSNCFFNSGIVYIDLRKEVELYDSRLKSINFVID